MLVKGRTQKLLYLEKFHSKYNSSCQELKSLLTFNLLKPTGYVMHQPVEHSTIVRSAHTVFMGDRRNEGESNCKSGDGTGRMAQPWIFMMIMMYLSENKQQLVPLTA
jgi:hypothetical protein